MSHSENRSAGRRGLRNRLTRRIAAQYVLALFTFVAVFLLCFFFGWQICSSITWYPEDPLYQFLHLLLDYLPLTLGVPLLAGWAILTYAFMAKPLRYLDEVIDGVGSQLIGVVPEDPEVTLFSSFGRMPDPRGELQRICKAVCQRLDGQYVPLMIH